MSRRYHNPNSGKSPYDPSYDHSWDDEEMRELYDEACEERAERDRDERDMEYD